MIRLASWNINSVRLRLDLVTKFIAEFNPTVLCLQETKSPDEFFPTEAFSALGYPHQALWGMKGYNGVAILSRLPLTHMTKHRFVNKDDCRHISAQLPQGLAIHCCYVPAGGDIPDPHLNEKFLHKLNFVTEQIEFWKKRKSTLKATVIMGDLNIAPLEHDVWSHRQMLSVVSHTPLEVEQLLAWQACCNFVDTLRCFVPHETKLYSWWSYRAQDWRASDRGRRLDHLWISQDLRRSLRNGSVIKDARGWLPKPSDHVPVLIDLDD